MRKTIKQLYRSCIDSENSIIIKFNTYGKAYIKRSITFDTITPARENNRLESFKIDNMKTGTFKLVGLSRPKSATLELLHTDRETFWATVDMPQDRFDALFDYCKGNWEDKKLVKCEFTHLDSDGVPVSCVVKEVAEY